MTKSLPLLTAALFAVSSFAQNVPVPLAPNQRSTPAEAPDLKPFDLDFPGGTPGALALAIGKATSKHLNVIIPAIHAQTAIMPIKVEKVTVPELFAAIEKASTRAVPQVISMGSGNSRSVQYKNISLIFQPNSQPVTNETIWSFQSTAATAEDEAILSAKAEPEQVCQYFQLAPYLLDRTVEDITTAIQTGWKMMKVDPVPQLSFHEETKLLIAVGAAQQIAQIPYVLGQLPRDDSMAVAMIAKWQAEIVDIEMKKVGDWEKQALEKRQQIARRAQLQKARETIENPPPMPGSVRFNQSR